MRHRKVHSIVRTCHPRGDSSPTIASPYSPNNKRRDVRMRTHAPTRLSLCTNDDMGTLVPQRDILRRLDRTVYGGRERAARTAVLIGVDVELYLRKSELIDLALRPYTLRPYMSENELTYSIERRNMLLNHCRCSKTELLARCRSRPASLW